MAGIEKGQKTGREKGLGRQGGESGVGGNRKAEELGSGDRGRGRQKDRGSQGGWGGQHEKESWQGREAGRGGTRVGRHKVRKGGSREAGFSSPAPGKRRASERRRRKDSAPRLPDVPRARRAPGGAQEPPRGREGPGVGATPPPAAALHLPGLGRRGRAVAAPAAATEGDAARTLGPRPALELRARAAHWLPHHGTASASANQRRAAPFGNFFPRAWARRGHAAALELVGAGEILGAGGDLKDAGCSPHTRGTGLELRANALQVNMLPSP